MLFFPTVLYSYGILFQGLSTFLCDVTLRICQLTLPFIDYPTCFNMLFLMELKCIVFFVELLIISKHIVTLLNDSLGILHVEALSVCSHADGMVFGMAM